MKTGYSSLVSTSCGLNFDIITRTKLISCANTLTIEVLLSNKRYEHHT